VSLRTDTIHNLLGGIVPALAALITIPLLLDKIGEVRFGVLSLVWLLLGHFGVFDFGLARATANRIAKLAPDAQRERRQVFWTSLWLNLAFGLLGAALLYALAATLLVHVFAIEQPALGEILSVTPWVAAAVPLTTVAGVLGGALDGRGRFGVANGLQACGAVLVLSAPVVAAYTISADLGVLVIATVLARAASVALLFVANLRLIVPGIPLLADRRHGRELFGYGAWISISTLIMPFFVTLDKFMVGALLGAAAVTYYTIPDQLVRRISALPAALTRGLFPRISAAGEAGSHDLSLRSARVLAGILTPAVAALILAMHPFLSLWIGAAFADVASRPGIVLAVGIWLNSLAMIPSAYLQAIGRPDVTAKCHLIEIVPHAVTLWLCVRFFGVLGAAVAILLVTVLDTVLLMAYARMQFWRMQFFWQAAAWIVVAGAVGFAGYDGAVWRYGIAAALLGGCAIWGARVAPEIVASAAASFERMAGHRLRRRT
jgi:O-antigen/teichoic acid export membrane protein